MFQYNKLFQTYLSIYLSIIVFFLISCNQPSDKHTVTLKNVVPESAGMSTLLFL